jgi:hypothetical protein
MIKYGRGHGGDLIKLFASTTNNLSLAMSFVIQFLARYSFAG